MCYECTRDFDLPGVFEVWALLHKFGSGLVYGIAIIHSFMSKVGCLCILVFSFFFFCWSNDNAMMRTSCFLGLERNSTCICSYMKAACQRSMWSYWTGILKRGAGTLNSAPFCAEKGGISWANNIWISFVCQTKQKLTTILSFYFDRYYPHCLVEFKLEADTSSEAHLSVCVRCMPLIASIGPLMTLAYLRAESLTNTAMLGSQGSVHRTLLDESEWEIFQACELICLHVWF